MQSACAAVYCHMWSLRLCHIFPRFLINDTAFGETLLNTKSVFWFSVQLLSEIFPILGIQRHIIINASRSSCKISVILVRFCLNFNILDRFSKKKTYLKFPQNQSIGKRVVACEETDGWTDGRTDRQTEMSKLIFFFRNFANWTKNGTNFQSTCDLFPSKYYKSYSTKVKIM